MCSFSSRFSLITARSRGQAKSIWRRMLCTLRSPASQLDSDIELGCNRDVSVTCSGPSPTAFMKKDSFDLFCPACNRLVEAKVIARGSGGFRGDAVDPFDEVDTEYHGEHYSVALCRRCCGPFLVRESLFGVLAEFETITEEEVLFPIATARNLEGVPEPVRRSLEQADPSFATGSYDAAALMCRRALEAVCRALAASGSNLALKLRDLHEAGHINQKL